MDPHLACWAQLAPGSGHFYLIYTRFYSLSFELGHAVLATAHARRLHNCQTKNLKSVSGQAPKTHTVTVEEDRCWGGMWSITYMSK
ncbi:hypothetical protein BDZ94DRAFT_1268359 [Collybia nuda]|uniref:Uncharacterized protein n=1 Tax=Collybia nuda TaxID=64659 RepID=A0A9P5XZ35_9AGAR|nr:hypothetical protein BDZ94DRAFT_1268359 [Collybia nuda]